MTTTATIPAPAATTATTAVTGTSLAASANKTTAAGQELSSNFSQFLKLLTTQLKNQDPLNPMNSSKFTEQLVQYSQVEQQLGTNAKLDNLTTLSMNSSLSLALGYVGKDITYTSAEMNYDGTTPVGVSYNLATAAKTATANILDANNNVIATKAVDPGTGTHNFTWDGTLADGTKASAGTYSVNINAPDATSGKAETVTTAVTGLVRGVENQNGVPSLLVGARSISLGNVINTSLPGTPTGA